MHKPRHQLRAVPRPLSERSDATVIVDSLGDPRIFAELFDRHWAQIHAFCTSRAGAAGEDIAADAFRLAFDRRDRYDRAFPDAGPWLFGIASNLLRQFFRSAQRRGRAEDRSAALAPAGPADETIGELERQLLGPELTEALGQLEAADRDALLLFAWADMEYAQIARAMGVPVGTVRSRIHRARQRTQTFLSERTSHVA